MATANKQWLGYERQRAGAGYLDIDAAVRGTTTQSANTGTPVSNLLTTGPEGVLTPSVSWSSVSWSSVSWSSVSWSSVSWSSVSWSSVSWSSDYWGDVTVVEVPSSSSPPKKTLARAAMPTLSLAPVEQQSYRLFLPMITLSAQ
jgi:hypothetical protein